MKTARVYNANMLAWLSKHYPIMMIGELTAQFNKTFGKSKTPQQIKGCLTNHKIKAGVKRTKTEPKYQEKHLAWLAENYLTMKIDQLTKEFNKKFRGFNANQSQIKSTVKRYQIKSNRTGQFEKGQESWNKGKKGINLGGQAGWFKKGCKAINHKEIGSTRINRDGYIEVKVAEPSKWQLMHRVIWRKHHGDIPKNMVVIFKDNNKLNCEIDNLMLISRGQLAVMNKAGLGQAPKEYKESAALYANLVMKITTKDKPKSKVNTLK